MARPLYKAFIQLRADDTGLKADMDRQASSAGTSAGKTGSRGYLRAFGGGIKAGIRQALDGDKAADESGKSAGRSWSRGFRRSADAGGGTGGKSGLLGGLLAGAGGAAAGGVVAAGVAAGTAFFAGLKTGITQAASNQQSILGFDTLLPGGRAVAEKFFSDLKAFAATTPFELPGLVDNARGLLGVGVAAKDVLPQLTALGNASSALGLDQDRFSRVMLAVQQIMSKGKVQTEELLQITEAGIPIFQLLSKATGKPLPELQKLMQQGKLLSKDVLPKLFTQMNKDYGGAMEAQSKTLNGVWSTFKDTLRNALADGVEPLIPILSNAVPKAADATGKAIKGIADGAKIAARGLKDGLGSDSFNPILTSLGQLKATAGPALLSLIGPLTEFVRTVAPPVLDAGRQVLQVLGTAFGEVGRLIQSDLAPAVRAFLPAVAPVARFLLTVFGASVVGALKGVVKVVEGVLKVISGLFNVFSGLLTGNWSRAWEGIKQIGSGALKAILGALQVWWNVGILKAFRLGFAGIKALVTGGWGTIKGLFSLAGKATDGIIRGMWALIKLAFTTGIRASVNLMTTLPGLLLKALGAVGKLLFNAGRSILAGLRDGMFDAARSVGGWIKDIGGRIVTAVKNFFGIRSPSKVFHGLGVHLLEGLIGGLSSSNPLDIAKTALGGLPNALGAMVSNGLGGIGALGGKAIAALGKVKGIFGGLFGGSGKAPAGVSRWAGTASQALALAGAPQSWLPSLLRRMQRESGGNPNAVNNWDSNARAGDPSRGLMQTIGATFNAYAGALRGRGPYDPLANIYAAVRYTMARYGTGPRGWDRAGGYDSGGLLQPGRTLVTNLTGRPERVLDAERTARLDALLSRPAAGGAEVAAAFVAALAGTPLALMVDGAGMNRVIDARLTTVARGATTRRSVI